MTIVKGRTLGLDLGIGSCGWALIDWADDPGNVNPPAAGKIIALGVWMFDVPETDKERTPTNQIRRQMRGMRRVLRRRRQRMAELRHLFLTHGLLASGDRNALALRLDPWRLRAEALDRVLEASELAVVLGHIAKHRGFKSNSKQDRGANAPSDSSKMLKAIEETREAMAKYRTVGELFFTDARFAGRKRNRDGDYTRSILRADQESEIGEIFTAQRRFGNPLASAKLESEYRDVAFYQRPLQDSEERVGDCPFEPDEKRAAKHAYSFELFRLLSRLAALRVRSGRQERPLSPDEIAAASKDFGEQRGLTFKRLRKLLDLRDDERFEGIALEDEGKRDAVARTGTAMPGSYAIRKVLGPAWQNLRATPEKLDRIAFVLAFRDDVASIRLGLEGIGLEPLILEALMREVADGAFGDFRGAGHVSAKACRAIIPHLARGLVYSEACAAAGYDHSHRPETRLDDIANPIARKALTEACKQVKAIVREYGLPERIHIELAREVGKGKEERDEISRGIEKRNKDKDRRRAEFAELVGRVPGGEELLRYELWKEQGGRCLYTDEPIPAATLVAGDNSVQVDHILPWSRSGDDSFVNKTLCTARANQEKKGRTPFEWLGGEEKRWNTFATAVETNKMMKGRKKRNYVLKDASVLEEKFRPRNLNDTRYATRLLADLLKHLYPDDGTRHVLARPGPLTDRLRRGWGIQDLKKNEVGERVANDRHHALDALVVAATSEGSLQRLTRAWQAAEAMGGHRDFSRLDPPWPGFIEETKAALADIFVARAERRRARGEGHEATIRQVKERAGEAVVFERKAIDKLTEADLARIKDFERNAKLIEALRVWIAAGKPKDAPPLSPKGDPIRKVRLATNKKPDVLVREGAADRGEIVRIDVFTKHNRRGVAEFFLVPIYPHQVSDRENWPSPPNRAVKAHVPEAEWPEMTAAYGFAWSLYPLSYLELVKRDGEAIDGYLRSFNRNSGALAISPQFTKEDIRDGIGAKTLVGFRKFQIDRLGRRYAVAREIRTWHGAACI